MTNKTKVRRYGCLRFVICELLKNLPLHLNIRKFYILKKLNLHKFLSPTYLYTKQYKKRKFRCRCWCSCRWLCGKAITNNF